ncbi:MAG: sarcosine oxidase subunit delta [Paracoccaceae bacterium]
MRIRCPLCGDRDLREFYYRGAAVALDRPAPGAVADAWNNYVHDRENPAGVTRDLWHHQSGCAAWIIVTRNTLTHEVLETELAAKAERAKS